MRICMSVSVHPSDLASPRAVARGGGLHTIGVYVLLAGAFLPIADFFIVNVALPTISDSLKPSPAELELVVAVYGVAYAAMLVLGGRLGDRFGRHLLFQAGLVGFIVASLLCGVAASMEVLISARLAQGATAAMLNPQVLAICHAHLRGEQKARALALYGATSGIAAIVGQLAGGLLVSANIAGTSWRPIFLINVPLGIIVLVASRMVLPESRSPRQASLDLPGTILFAATLTALFIPLTEGHSLGWPAWTWMMLASALILAAITYVVESRTEARGHMPLLPPSLLKLSSVWRGLAMITPYSLGFGAFMFVIALTVQNGLHADAFAGGLVILPMAVMFFIGSVISPRVIQRFGRRALAVGGLVQASGLALLVGTVVIGWPDLRLFELIGPLLLIGSGQSMLFSGLFRVVLSDVPAHLAGIGGGVLITLQQTGLALGVATLGTIYLALEPRSIPEAFAASIGAQLIIIVLLVLAVPILPPLSRNVAHATPAEI
jgi:MFS family permease